MPQGRKADYAIWRACERAGVCPPGIKSNWDDCNVVAQSNLIAYSQIRDVEDAETGCPFMG